VNNEKDSHYWCDWSNRLRINPSVLLLIRDTEKTSALVQYLFDHDILVTGLNYPVVPKGDEEIRLQVSATQTEKDIDYLIEKLKNFNA
jgi:glycine C-acetyltransferase